MTGWSRPSLDSSLALKPILLPFNPSQLKRETHIHWPGTTCREVSREEAVCIASCLVVHDAHESEPNFRSRTSWSQRDRLFLSWQEWKRKMRQRTKSEQIHSHRKERMECKERTGTRTNTHLRRSDLRRHLLVVNAAARTSFVLYFIAREKDDGIFLVVSLEAGKRERFETNRIRQSTE